MSDDVLKMIQMINDTRSLNGLPRRALKLTEEAGEVAEAVLNVTSKMNGKNLSWLDVREESVDAAIVAFDLALTPIPGEENLSQEDIIDNVYAMLILKLGKWKKSLDSGKAAALPRDDAV